MKVGTLPAGVAADVVFCSFPGHVQLEEVLTGQDGVIAGLCALEDRAFRRPAIVDLGTSSIDSVSGLASILSPALPNALSQGTHIITGFFNSTNPNFGESNASTGTFVVNPATTHVTSVTGNPTSSTFGTSVTFTATVTTAVGSLPITGDVHSSVTFVDTTTGTIHFGFDPGLTSGEALTYHATAGQAIGNLLDTNHNRKLEASELRQAVQQGVQMLFQVADVNQDGQISPAELNRAVGEAAKMAVQVAFQTGKALAQPPGQVDRRLTLLLRGVLLGVAVQDGALGFAGPG